MKIFTLLLLVLSSPVGQSKDLNGPLQTGWKGEKVCEKLSENKQQNILRCIFPPGIGHERHKHNANFGYAISGGKVQIKDKKGTRVVELAKDSHFNSLGTEWHEILNVGDTTIVYIILESK
jgi:hypothetical protein